MNKYKLCILAILVALLTNSCNQGFQSATDMFQWINDPDNGLVKTKTINGIEIELKFLPPEFLTYREVKRLNNYSEEYVDSLLNYYRNSYSFLLKIGPDEKNQDQDIMLKGVTSIEEFNIRAQKLNFEIGEYVSLTADNIEYEPVLSNMENVYGMHSHRNIYLVFSPNDNNMSLLEAKKLDIRFNDELFETGISHFVYIKKNINNIPEVKFWKYQ